MGSKTAFLLGLIIGIGGGALGTYYYMKDKFEGIVEEEVESVKEVFNKRLEEETKKIKEEASKQPKEADKVDRNMKAPNNEMSVSEYAALIRENGYVKYSEMSKNKKIEAIDMIPVVITPDEYGLEEDYDQISLNYHINGVLTDDSDIEEEDIETTIGFLSINHFGEYEPDMLYVRNDRKKTYYEVTLDQTEFEED